MSDAQSVTHGLRANGRILELGGWLQVTEGQQSFAGERSRNERAARTQ